MHATSEDEQTPSLIDALKPLFKYVADLEKKIKYYEELIEKEGGNPK